MFDLPTTAPFGPTAMPPRLMEAAAPFGPCADGDRSLAADGVPVRPHRAAGRADLGVFLAVRPGDLDGADPRPAVTPAGPVVFRPAAA